MAERGSPPPKRHNYLASASVFIQLSLIFSISYGADTLSVNQSLSGDQTLVSTGGRFELGFFRAGMSSNYYIGIWLKRVNPPPTIVWVANREIPIVDRYSSELRIVDGNLVLFNELKIAIWSTNVSSSTATSLVVVVLLDDGNLVLRDGSNSDLLAIWQSFDHPTDTWLPYSKIGYNNGTGTKQVLTSWKSSDDPAPGLFSFELDPVQKQCILRWNRSQQYWTSGYWDGQIFNLLPQRGLDSLYNFSYITNENENYTTYSLLNQSITSRFILDVSGQIKQMTWVENTQEWNILWVQPSVCDVYARCGAFGKCNNVNARLPICSCLTGFRPRSDTEMKLGDYSGGCVRRTSLECGKVSGANVENYGFFTDSKFRFPPYSQQVPVQNAVDCESLCLNNCSCVAYAYDAVFVQCEIWNDELLDIKLSETEGTNKLSYIKLASSDLPKTKRNGRFPRDKLGITIASVLAFVLLCIIGYISYRKKASRQESNRKYSKYPSLVSARLAKGSIELWKLREDDNKNIDVPFFEFNNILAATNDFSDSNMLGKGGFGPVYKGNLAGGQEVAVKRLSSHSGQGLEEFKNEVGLIAKLQHRNLVRIVGYCTEEEEKIILYEFMQNKSLDNFIFDQNLGKLLDWSKRFEIIMGITRGLLYLHQDSRLRIIHRDFKTSNILLDEEMIPKISDFGLARIVGGRETEANTNRVVGSYGYMSPEYAFHGDFSVKSDVFSFGVVVLEIVSGKRNSRFYQSEQDLYLLSYAWNLWKERKPLDFMDHTLTETINSSEALKCIIVGLLCVQDDPSDRPTMTDVVLMLGGDIANLPDPKQPTFVARKNLQSSSFSERKAESSNGLTVTLVEGR